MKVLVVEDEPALRDVIAQSLKKENFLVEVAETYHAALRLINAYDYDCILLDIMLPDGSGLNILQELKNLEKTDNVIIISAKDSLDDRINGLNLGADDYLTKPFHMAELNARIKSVLRRKTFNGRPTLEVGNLQINPDERSVTIHGTPVLLNRKETDILLYFVVNKNRLIVKSALAEHVWGNYADEATDYEFIYSQIKNLRKKLKDHQAGVEIRAVYGIGYKLVVL